MFTRDDTIFIRIKEKRFTFFLRNSQKKKVYLVNQCLDFKQEVLRSLITLYRYKEVQIRDLYVLFDLQNVEDHQQRSQSRFLVSFPS